jgi:chaperonin GroEL (HSP60 family)
VQTSLGPFGRNKIVINHLQKLILTSDAATILRELEVVHPAAKLLVMACQQQEAEMGDATNLVIVLAGELLKKAEELLRMGLKTSDVVVGYEKACEFALKTLDGMSIFILFWKNNYDHSLTCRTNRAHNRQGRRCPLKRGTQQSNPHSHFLQAVR